MNVLLRLKEKERLSNEAIMLTDIGREDREFYFFPLSWYEISNNKTNDANRIIYFRIQEIAEKYKIYLLEILAFENSIVSGMAEIKINNGVFSLGSEFDGEQYSIKYERGIHDIEGLARKIITEYKIEDFNSIKTHGKINPDFANIFIKAFNGGILTQ